MKSKNLQIMENIERSIRDIVGKYHDTDQITARMKERLEEFAETVNNKIEEFAEKIKTILDDVRKLKNILCGIEGIPDSGILHKYAEHEREIENIKTAMMGKELQSATGHGEQIGLEKGKKEGERRVNIQIKKWQVIVTLVGIIVANIVAPFALKLIGLIGG